MENIFKIAEFCLHHTDVSKKIEATHRARKLLENHQLSFDSTVDVQSIANIKFPGKPELLKPRDMPRRRLNSPQGKAAFFHALAHIEFIAIYLAWDIIYRFRGLEEKFYQDWLVIADEEAQHFALICMHLKEMGVEYGDLPAHQGLWEHAEDTAEDILARLAIIPRCMEARGLDVTPNMIEKFSTQDDQKSVRLLTRILNDEIGHVQVGSFWFKKLCEQNALNHEEKYKELIIKFYNGKPKGPFNRELRIIAGFSNAEINWLEERV